MTTEFEAALSAALRERADAVPRTPMPELGREPQRPRPGRLLPVAAAVVAAVGIGSAVVAITPAGDDAPPPATSVVPPRPQYRMQPGEVYYLRAVRSGPDDAGLVEVELWQSPQTTGPWRQRAIGGTKIEHGRIVANPGERPVVESGRCYPSRSIHDQLCQAPTSWDENVTLAFLAAVPTTRDALSRQLRAVARADSRVQVNRGDLTPAAAFGKTYLAYKELSYARDTLTRNGVSPALRAGLRQVITSLPGLEVRPNMTDLLGRHGTGYRIRGYEDDFLIFDGDVYLGTPHEGLVHGIAPGIGEPPSRMFD